MVLRANENVTRGVRGSAKAADRFASCREERMREGDAFPLEWGAGVFGLEDFGVEMEDAAAGRVREKGGASKRKTWGAYW